MSQIDDTSEARIIPSGEPVEGGMTLFEGSAEGARAFLGDYDQAQRADLSVWTKGHIWSAEEFLADGRP